MTGHQTWIIVYPRSGQPIDIGHIVEFDRDDGVTHERKTLGDMPLKCRGLSQEARADQCFARTVGGIDMGLGRDLSRAGGRPEMRRHPVDAAGLELVGHQSLLLRRTRIMLSFSPARRDVLVSERRPTERQIWDRLHADNWRL
jgi:hypothetical protein